MISVITFNLLEAFNKWFNEQTLAKTVVQCSTSVNILKFSEEKISWVIKLD